jgi:hypothetical protein
LKKILDSHQNSKHPKLGRLEKKNKIENN